MSAAKQINIANLAKLTQLHLLPDDAQKLQQDLQQTLVFIDQGPILTSRLMLESLLLRYSI